MYKAKVMYLNEFKEQEAKKKSFLFKRNAIRWVRKICLRKCGVAFIFKNGESIYTIL